jgi:hypothetical protein
MVQRSCFDDEDDAVTGGGRPDDGALRLLGLLSLKFEL